MSPLSVPRPVFEETFQQLRRCGSGQLECVNYWCGPIDETMVVERVVHPLHDSGEFGYVVDSGWVNEFFLELRQVRQSIRVQIHTHPAEANHSMTDDQFAIAPASGFLSLVIPDFAEGPAELRRTHLVEMQSNGDWTELDPERAIVIS